MNDPQPEGHMASHIGRRKFLATLGGAAAAWPLVARAQQRERMRRIGLLMPYVANDPQAQMRNAAFLQGLQQLGWTVGQNVQLDYRWSGVIWTIRADTRPNWRRLRQTSSSPLAVRPLGRCSRQPAPCRSCLCSSLIRSARASSTAWRDRVATPPALPRTITALARNGSNCSRKSRQT